MFFAFLISLNNSFESSITKSSLRIFSIVFSISIDPEIEPEIYSEMNNDLQGTVRHEIEHILQEKAVPGTMPFPSRYMLNKINKDPLEYFMSDFEMEAMVMGFYRTAKTQKEKLDIVIQRYLNYFIEDKSITGRQAKVIKDKWIAYAKEHLPHAQFKNKKIVKESLNFERGASERTIKDRLFGFRPGELLTYAQRKTSKPYIEVYMFIEPTEELVHVDSGPRMEVCQIGNLVKNSNEEITNFIMDNHKILEHLNLFQQNKRSLADQEIAMIKKTLSKPENAYFIKKIKRDTSIFPALNEDFKRGRTEQEIKRSFFEWRKGQILAVHPGSEKKRPDHSLLYVFSEKKPQLIVGAVDDWTIHCLEIGYIAGTPSHVQIAFGPAEGIVIKRESSLEEPTPDEKNLIDQALQKKDFQKYIRRATELVGVKPFV